MTGATDFDIATLRARLVPDDESQQSRNHEQAADRSVVELSPQPTHISPLPAPIEPSYLLRLSLVIGISPVGC